MCSEGKQSSMGITWKPNLGMGSPEKAHSHILMSFEISIIIKSYCQLGDVVK